MLVLEGLTFPRLISLGSEWLWSIWASTSVDKQASGTGSGPVAEASGKHTDAHTQSKPSLPLFILLSRSLVNQP